MGLLKQYAPLIFACFFAMLSSVSVYNYLANRESVSIAQPEMTQAVVLAKSHLPMGTKLTDADLTTEVWPKAIVAEGYFHSMRPLVGRILRSNVIAGEPITPAKLLEEGRSLSDMISPDMRGVSVTVPKSETLMRVLDQGGVVDVIAILDNNNPAMNAKVIATGVRVIAVKKDPTEGKSGRESKTMEVLLLVKPRDASYIIYAKNHGEIELTARNEMLGVEGF